MHVRYVSIALALGLLAVLPACTRETPRAEQVVLEGLAHLLRQGLVKANLSAEVVVCAAESDPFRFV